MKKHITQQNLINELKNRIKDNQLEIEYSTDSSMSHKDIELIYMELQILEFLNDFDITYMSPIFKYKLLFPQKKIKASNSQAKFAIIKKQRQRDIEALIFDNCYNIIPKLNNQNIKILILLLNKILK
ncbi:Hypothetical_protein [Hexamita inflata]|uniref:Hypothetical_protein n=1 Tax=Hexamita inflata TaxID=28002 RepID=A0AA86V4L2_9EUKA|nr:Hypothetical protein HINF_LOCUS44298 [Hexamita inflata]